jgi:hypothetical protein
MRKMRRMKAWFLEPRCTPCWQVELYQIESDGSSQVVPDLQSQRCHLRSVDRRSTVNEKIYGQNSESTVKTVVKNLWCHLNRDFSPHRAWDGFKSYTVHILTFSGKLCFGKPRNHIVHCFERLVLRVTRITKFFFRVSASEPVGRNLRSNGEIYCQKWPIFDEIYGQGFWRCGNAVQSEG